LVVGETNRLSRQQRVEQLQQALDTEVQAQQASTAARRLKELEELSRQALISGPRLSGYAEVAAKLGPPAPDSNGEQGSTAPASMDADVTVTRELQEQQDEQYAMSLAKDQAREGALRADRQRRAAEAEAAVDAAAQAAANEAARRARMLAALPVEPRSTSRDTQVGKHPYS
jgi:Skp family chaperone for outer membrane proteins